MCVLAFLLLLLLPLYAIFWKSLPNGVLFTTMRLPIVRAALRLSLVTTTVTLGVTIFFGTPIAYLLARYRFPGYTILDSLIDLPMVLPPSVAGLGLLIAFGRRGLLGDTFAHLGFSLPFTAPAVVIAQCFVASPFYIKAAKAGFLGVNRDYEEAAATFGSSGWHTFTRITLPLAFPSIIGGARYDLGARPRGVRRNDLLRGESGGQNADDPARHLSGGAGVAFRHSAGDVCRARLGLIPDPHRR